MKKVLNYVVKDITLCRITFLCFHKSNVEQLCAVEIFFFTLFHNENAVIDLLQGQKTVNVVKEYSQLRFAITVWHDYVDAVL